MIKSKIAICFFITAIVVLPATLALGENEISGFQSKVQLKEFNNQERIEFQQQRLTDVEKSSARYRLDIEKWYQKRLAQIKKITERDMERIGLTSRVIWTEYIKANNGINYTDSWLEMGNDLETDSYFFQSLHPFFLGRKTRLTMSMLAEFCASGLQPDFLMDDELKKTEQKPVETTKFVHYLEIGKVKRLLLVMREYERQVGRVEKQRQIRLAEVDSWQAGLKENVAMIIDQINEPTEQAQVGIVNAICCSDSEKFCMIAGFEESALQQGDSIGNVKIIGITADKVEFKKGWKSWQQTVGQPADSAWF